VWSQKRFKDPHTEEMPCNPQLATFEKAKNKNEQSQTGLSDGWLPYKDDNDTDPFEPF
jgi:hypothetical protein